MAHDVSVDETMIELAEADALEDIRRRFGNKGGSK